MPLQPSNEFKPGQGPVFELAPSSDSPELPGLVPVSGEHRVERASSVEVFDLADPNQDVFGTRPTRAEIEKFVSNCGGANFKEEIAKLSPEAAIVLIREAFRFLDQIEAASRNPKDPILIESQRTEIAERSAAGLKHVVALCSGLYRDPSCIISTFGADAAARIKGNESLAGLVSDQLDRARLTFILASGVGLREEDTAFANKSEESRDKTVERDAKLGLPTRLSAEEKEKRRLEKIARLKTGSKGSEPEAPPPTEAPKTDEPQSIEEEAKAREAMERRGRLENAKPTAAHSAYRDILPKATQQNVYDLADALVSWASSEITCSGSTKMVLDPAQIERRASLLRARLDPKLKEEEQILKALNRTLKELARRIPTDVESAKQLGVTARELGRLSLVTAEGMGLIRHDTPSVSAAVLRKAQKELSDAQAKRTENLEGWRKDRWGREGLDKPIGGV